MITVGIITVSDRSSKGLRQDASGPAVKQWAERKGYVVKKEIIVPDEREDIIHALMDFSDSGIDLIVTTGGTGFAPRDVTPEATLAVIDKHAPGFAEMMRMRSSQVTPNAILSRAVSGIRKGSLIINLPGSPAAVRENLEFIEDAIPHAVELLQSGVTDCGSGR